jgi:hypothetical protein
VHLDFSKAAAIHRLYGHPTFYIEALKAEKTVQFCKVVCEHAKCNGKKPTWKDNRED